MKNGEEEWQVSLELIDTLWNVNFNAMNTGD